MAKVDNRPYDSSDLKELMDNIGGWAKSWDDAMWYVEEVARYDADFARKEVKPLAGDLREVEKKGVRFDTDYRKLYKAITGKDCDGCPEPEGIKSYGINPRRLAKQVLEKLDYPVKKPEVVRKAKEGGASKQAVQVLEKLDDHQFQSPGAIIEAIGDITWDHD